MGGPSTAFAATVSFCIWSLFEASNASEAVGASHNSGESPMSRTKKLEMPFDGRLIHGRKTIRTGSCAAIRHSRLCTCTPEHNTNSFGFSLPTLFLVAGL